MKAILIKANIVILQNKQEKIDLQVNDEVDDKLDCLLH
jgi:hypothetical protein